jgi:hypothetical protein
MGKTVEVSKDALGWCLIYTRDVGKCREGDPVCADEKQSEIRYFKSHAAAERACKALNATGGGAG